MRPRHSVLYFKVAHADTYLHPGEFFWIYFPQGWKKTKFNSQIFAFHIRFFSWKKDFEYLPLKKVRVFFPPNQAWKISPDLPTCNPERVVQNDVPLRKNKPIALVWGGLKLGDYPKIFRNVWFFEILEKTWCNRKFFEGN